MVRNMRTTLSRNSGGRDEVERTRHPTVKAPPKWLAFATDPTSRPTTTVCRGSQHADWRFALVKQRDFYFPCVGLTARLARQPAATGRVLRGNAIKDIALPCKSGRDAVTTHGELVFNDGFPPCSGPRVSKTGSPPHPVPHAHRPATRKLRPLAHPAHS